MTVGPGGDAPPQRPTDARSGRSRPLSCWRVLLTVASLCPKDFALEKGETGACYHAIAEEGVPFKTIAEVIGRRLNIPVVGLSQEEASDHFGWFARFAGIDAAAFSERTRQFLGWEPKQPGLIDDLDQTYYFDA